MFFSWVLSVDRKVQSLFFTETEFWSQHFDLTADFNNFFVVVPKVCVLVRFSRIFFLNFTGYCSDNS